MGAKPRAPSLRERLDALARLHGEPPRSIPRTPFDWIVWENVAYLVDDERRAAVFRELKKEVGLTAEAIAGAAHGQLLAVTQLGGMDPGERAKRLKAAAELALEHGGGGLESVLELETKQARKMLKQFPGIGEPGAEKILSACGKSEELALDSNGLRVLVRLGYGAEAKAYAQTYKSVIEATAGEVADGARGAWRAHRLLRTHGMVVCKRTAPKCGACPLVSDCAFALGNG